MVNTPVTVPALILDLPPESAGIPESNRRAGFFRWDPRLGDGAVVEEEESHLRAGRYELLGSLGAGGAARVFLARRMVQPGHLLALKIFAEEFSIDPVETRLVQESVTRAERLAVPAMVHTYEVGEIDGRVYVAMERLHGWTLRQLRRACPFGLPDKIVTSIRRQIVKGLHPGNVMVTVEGRVRVLELDAAPRFASRSCRKRPTRVGGKDTQLLQRWIRHLEPNLPPLPGPGVWSVDV